MHMQGKILRYFSSDFWHTNWGIIISGIQYYIFHNNIKILKLYLHDYLDNILFDFFFFNYLKYFKIIIIIHYSHFKQANIDR